MFAERETTQWLQGDSPNSQPISCAGCDYSQHSSDIYLACYLCLFFFYIHFSDLLLHRNPHPALCRTLDLHSLHVMKDINPESVEQFFWCSVTCGAILVCILGDIYEVPLHCAHTHIEELNLAQTLRFGLCSNQGKLETAPHILISAPHSVNLNSAALNNAHIPPV